MTRTPSTAVTRLNAPVPTLPPRAISQANTWSSASRGAA